MWTAFGNGSGLHGGGGGGGGGGGYVASQGWEFVPCSRVEQQRPADRRKSRSPLRRISSPPSILSQIFEPQQSAAAAAAASVVTSHHHQQTSVVRGGAGGGGTPLEVLRGQVWPPAGVGGGGHDPQSQQQQQQAHHVRLKKKFEDLKKRHGHDREEWMHEKELLLREVADIQGGENRRILLDLKLVLEEVQGEVKREEEKRSELQLQYTRDRCAWELEKTELKCRIAQLEAREGAGLVGAAGGPPGPLVLRSAVEARGETPSLRREREEQRRLLADTQTAAMDLRCRLEHNERDWLREKAELLERFDTERRDWESQLRDMQRKIEELYCEVRAKREGTGANDLDSGTQDYDDSIALRLSLPSTTGSSLQSTTGSSLLSNQSRSEHLSSSSQSDPPKPPPFPGFSRRSNISGDSGSCSPGFQREPSVGDYCSPDNNAEVKQSGKLKDRGPLQPQPAINNQDAVDTAELDAVLQRAQCRGALEWNTDTSKGNLKNAQQFVSPQGGPLSAELICSSDKKKNITALNAALKEIARVSEELCSYQDEIRKKSGEKRNRSQSLYLPEDRETLLSVKTSLEIEEPLCDLNQIYDDLRALEQENWITVSPDNTWRGNRKEKESWTTNSNGPDNVIDSDESPETPAETSTPAAPPIPPRTASWNLIPTPEPEPQIPESSSMITGRSCHSPCVLVDNKCPSPSIVRKFEAMLQENEGKVLSDSVVLSCAAPANSNCNAGCCHNRWSCDSSKFNGGKLSAHVPVQKSLSEVNILTAAKDNRPAFKNLVQTPKQHQMPFTVKESPVELPLPSLDSPLTCRSLQGSRRNIMLEQKTAEFNRTLFQAEMGRGVEDADADAVCAPVSVTARDSNEIPSRRDATVDARPQCAEVTPDTISTHLKVSLTPSTSDPVPRVPDMRLRRSRNDSHGHEVRVKQELAIDLSPQQIRPNEATAEVESKPQVPGSPTRCTQHRAATETVMSGQTHQTHHLSGSSPSRVKPQEVRVHRASDSPQQPFAESKPQQLTLSGHQAQPGTGRTSAQPDTSRPGPRVMNDHPWKPLTLAAYPRPEGSRSNYGAVERILKSYESAAWAQQHQNQQKQAVSSPNISPTRHEEKVAEMLDMLDMEPAAQPPPAPRHTHSSQTSYVHITHTAQLSSHTATSVRDACLTMQDNKDASVSSPSDQKSFLRPARPANRRLPSRWANCAPSSTSSSPSATPVAPPSIPMKHISSFSSSYSAFHMETVII